MFFRWLKGDREEERTSASDELKALVRATAPDLDDATIALVGAVAGLLAVIAYADRSYSDEEQRAVREVLARLHEVDARAVDVIAELLASRIQELAHEPMHDYTRALVSLTTRDARLELLDALMDLAAADLVLSMEETNLLRRVARLLGLSDDDYLHAQAKHREHLSVLGARER